MSSVNFDILDLDTSELFDAEKFEPAPAGTYKCQFSWSQKEIVELAVAELEFRVIETVQLANANETPPEAGKKIQQALFLQQKDKNTGETNRNKMGEGQLKEVAMALRGVYGGNSTRETLDNAAGGEVLITVKVRAKKDDSEVKFNVLKTLECV